MANGTVSLIPQLEVEIEDMTTKYSMPDDYTVDQIRQTLRQSFGNSMPWIAQASIVRTGNVVKVSRPAAGPKGL